MIKSKEMDGWMDGWLARSATRVTDSSSIASGSSAHHHVTLGNRSFNLPDGPQCLETLRGDKFALY